MTGIYGRICNECLYICLLPICGHVFEEYIVRSTLNRLSGYHICLVLQKELTQMLKEGRIGNEKEDCLEDLAKSDDFDIYALIDFHGMNYVFSCLQAKTSIRDRVGRDRDFSIPVMEKHFWSVAVVLDGMYLSMPKFEHMVNGGGETQYRENGSLTDIQKQMQGVGKSQLFNWCGICKRKKNIH